MKVNFLDLKAQYANIKGEVDAAIQAVIDNTAFAAGPYVKQFEENFAAAHRVAHCVGVNSGTAALHAAMMALGIGAGDEVIVPANTFFATAEAVSLVGATPVFVDCDDTYYNLDPTMIEAAINEHTNAIVPVHLYGQPAQMEEILEIADRHNLLVIEDCAQAHLAEYNDIPVGSFGVVGCFSFYPGKNLGAYGEAGAVVTNDETLYKRLMAIRDHGMSRKYHHDMVGHNYRMEGIQGAVLDVKLRHLREWTASRQRNAALYDQKLRGIKEIVIPQRMADVSHVYHLYVIRAERRDELVDHLKEQGVFTGIHYPIPCHKQRAYAHLGYNDGAAPRSEQFARQVVSLPMFPELPEQEIDYVVEKIREFYHG